MTAIHSSLHLSIHFLITTSPALRAIGGLEASDQRPSSCKAKWTPAIIGYKTTKSPSRLAFKTLYSQCKAPLVSDCGLKRNWYLGLYFPIINSKVRLQL